MREPFGKAGLIVGIVALVAAMAGGAYAASGGLTSKQKKEVKEIAKSVQGTGPAGSQGPAGANGTNGANGKDGTNGTPGKDGTNGAPGSPWTAGGTLPSKATETGVWSVGHIENTTQFPGASGNPINVPVSFPIPLASELDYFHAHFIQANNKEFVVRVTPAAEVLEEEIVQPDCPGTVDAPSAKPGNLCVYTGKAHSLKPFKNLLSELDGLPSESGFTNPASGESGASVAGSTLEMFWEAADAATADVEGLGTWAVTAP